MAGHQRLIAGTRRGLLVLVAVVLAGHFAALHWASGLRMQAGTLHTMAPPMYTRLLAPQAPPPVQAPVAAPRRPRPRPKPTARLAPAPSTPRDTTSTVAQDTPAPPPLPAASEAVAAAQPDTPAAPVPDLAASAPATPASAAASSAVASTAGDSWPADTRLRYQLSGTLRGGPLYGSGRVLWQRQGTTYQARVEVDVPPFANFSMTSQGEVDASTLLPGAYEELRNGKPRGLKIREREVVLANGAIVPRPDGVQDTASQFVELSHRFATGRERLEVGRSVSLWMARPGAVDLWTYDIVERERLVTRLGEIEAFHLKPRALASPHGNIYMDMWFAPSLQYLPVRVRVGMGDEATVDLLVEGIDQR